MKHAAFAKFLQEKDTILQNLSKLNMTTLNLNNDGGHCNMLKVVNVLKPEVIFALPGINPKLMNSLIGNLVKERSYIHLDMDAIIKHAMKRCTEMGEKFACGEGPIDICDKLEQLKMIMFNNPNNKKFVITNFSTSLCDFEKFECEVCCISKVVTFHNPVPRPVNKHLEELASAETKALEVFNKFDAN